LGRSHSLSTLLARRYGPRITIMQSKHIIIGIAKIDDLNIPIEQAFSPIAAS
jgi:hypothetical protein